MANTLATPDWVGRETLTGFNNSLAFVSRLSREYDESFQGRGGAKIGATVQARLPFEVSVGYGEALQVQNLTDRLVPVSLDYQVHAGANWSGREATLELEEMSQRYIMPMAERLANEADVVAWADTYKKCWNVVGTPGTTPNTVDTYLTAKAKLRDGAIETMRSAAVLYPKAHTSIAGAASTLFNPTDVISQNYTNGEFSRRQLGIGSWLEDQNNPTFTTGAVSVASSPRVNGANQTGASLVTDGWGSGGLAGVEGDWFTIAGVYRVNPQSKQSTGELQQFVLTADATDTTGDATLSISPQIIPTGQFQNVTASPADDAVITYLNMADGGTYTATVSRVSMVLTEAFAAFATADLQMPEGNVTATRTTSRKMRLSILQVSDFDIRTYQNITRCDVLFGAAILQERAGVRVQG